MSDTNAIRYLFDFINTYLPLTVEEEKALKNRPKARKRELSVWIDETYKQCIVCGEIKPITEFYKCSPSACKQCYNSKRREEYRKGKINDR